MYRLSVACLPLVLGLAACSWVTLEKGAGEILVLPPERLTASCESLGKVSVSVLDKVGVLERHDEEVVEDLHVLARNHAAKLGGDTVVPLGPVKDGARRYEIHRCLDDAAVTKPVDGGNDPNVEVVPYTEGD